MRSSVGDGVGERQHLEEATRVVRLVDGRRQVRTRRPGRSGGTRVRASD